MHCNQTCADRIHLLSCFGKACMRNANDTHSKRRVFHCAARSRRWEQELVEWVKVSEQMRIAQYEEEDR